MAYDAGNLMMEPRPPPDPLACLATGESVCKKQKAAKRVSQAIKQNAHALAQQAGKEASNGRETE